MSEKPDLVSSFWAYHRALSGNRKERLTADEWYWAWNEVESAISTKPEDAVELLVELSEAADSAAETSYLGASLVEAFIVENQEWLVSTEGRPALDQLNEAVRRSASFRDAVGSVWYDSDEIPQLIRDQIPGLGAPLDK